MRKGGDGDEKQPEIVGNRRLMRFLGFVLLFGAPFWLEGAWTVASWWKPLIGVGPDPGFNTPFSTALKGVLSNGSSNLGEVWASVRTAAFSTPTFGMQLFLVIAIACILIMKRNVGR